MKIIKNTKGNSMVLVLLFFIIMVAIFYTFMPLFAISSVEQATTYLNDRGYVVFASGEYDELYNRINQTFLHHHTEQLVAPNNVPVSLTSGVGAYNLGDYSADFLALGEATSRFDIVAIGFGTPDINGTYTVILYCDDPGVEIGQVSFNRQAIFTASIYRDMSTVQLPAGTRIRAKMMDQTGGATCVCKIYYHYH